MLNAQWFFRSKPRVAGEVANQQTGGGMAENIDEIRELQQMGRANSREGPVVQIFPPAKRVKTSAVDSSPPKAKKSPKSPKTTKAKRARETSKDALGTKTTIGPQAGSSSSPKRKDARRSPKKDTVQTESNLLPSSSSHLLPLSYPLWFSGEHAMGTIPRDSRRKVS